VNEPKADPDAADPVPVVVPEEKKDEVIPPADDNKADVPKADEVEKPAEEVKQPEADKAADEAIIASGAAADVPVADAKPEIDTKADAAAQPRPSVDEPQTALQQYDK